MACLQTKEELKTRNIYSIDDMRKRFIGILCVTSGLMLSLAGCGGSEEVTPNPGPVIPDTVPGMTISGDAYDYRKTGQPERPYMLTYYDKMLMKAFMS